MQHGSEGRVGEATGAAIYPREKQRCRIAPSNTEVHRNAYIEGGADRSLVVRLASLEHSRGPLFVRPAFESALDAPKSISLEIPRDA